jgi:hypothetical protein
MKKDKFYFLRGLGYIPTGRGGIWSNGDCKIRVIIKSDDKVTIKK